MRSTGTGARPEARGLDVDSVLDPAAASETATGLEQAGFGGQVDRMIVHSELDPGPDVWPAMLAGAHATLAPLPAAKAP